MSNANESYRPRDRYDAYLDQRYISDCTFKPHCTTCESMDKMEHTVEGWCCKHCGATHFSHVKAAAAVLAEREPGCTS